MKLPRWLTTRARRDEARRAESYSDMLVRCYWAHDANAALDTFREANPACGGIISPLALYKLGNGDREEVRPRPWMMGAEAWLSPSAWNACSVDECPHYITTWIPPSALTSGYLKCLACRKAVS